MSDFKNLKFLHLLLMVSLAMFVVGSAWHGHHDHDHDHDHEADSCQWCLVAGMVLVMAVAWSGWTFSSANGGRVQTQAFFIPTSGPSDPFASRAPPIS